MNGGSIGEAGDALAQFNYFYFTFGALLQEQ